MSSNAIGEVTEEELEYSLSDDMGLSGDQMMAVLPEFLSVDNNRVLSIVEKVLCGVRTDVRTLHKMMSDFIFHSYLTVLRKKSSEECNPAKWIFDRIVEWGLDGNLLERREFKYLFDHCGAKFTISRFADFVKQRIALAKQKPPYDRFVILPYGFSVAKYFENDGDVGSFYEVCKAVVDNDGYFAKTAIPAMLKELNPDGALMSGFALEVDAAAELNSSLEREIKRSEFQLLTREGLFRFSNVDIRPQLKLLHEEIDCAVAVLIGWACDAFVDLVRHFSNVERGPAVTVWL